MSWHISFSFTTLTDCLIISVCETMEQGIGAVFSPFHPIESSSIVQSLCETMEVPLIETSWENTPVENYNYHFNLYPEPTILAKV